MIERYFWNYGEREEMTAREKIIEEVKELKAEPLMQKSPRAAIEYVEDNYPEVVDFLSTEGMIVGLWRALTLLLDEEETNNTK